MDPCQSASESKPAALDTSIFQKYGCQELAHVVFGPFNAVVFGMLNTTNFNAVLVQKYFYIHYKIELNLTNETGDVSTFCLK